MTLINRLAAALKDRYTIERELGRGGMATVYLARDHKHGRNVAIKVMDPHLRVPGGAERFLAEIRTAARLNHPHILPVFDSGEVDGLLYYVMPHVEGDSLRERLNREGALPVAEVVRIGTQLADALAYAHARGIIHRDIKPENILFANPGHAYLADFGLAKELFGAASSGLTQTGLVMGTLRYMSPEQCAGADVDARSDIYSVGCVLREMLGDERALRDIIERSTHARPAERYASAAALLQDLKQVAAAQSKAADRGERIGTGFLANVLRSPFAWGGALVAVALAFILFRPGPDDIGISPGESALMIAVPPFQVTGAEGAFLGDGLATLLATTLDGVANIRTLSPRAVSRAWTDDVVPVDAAVRRASTLGAPYVLLGSAVALDGETRVTATIRDSGGELARAQVTGRTDDILALVDSLALSLIRNLWRSTDPPATVRVAAITTGSLEAIRAYLQGEQLYRAGRWQPAIAAFERAVEQDSAFALAYYRLAETYLWIDVWGSPPALRATAAAFRHRDRLPTRERALVTASVLDNAGKVAAIDSMRAFVQAYPNDPEGWYRLGDVMAHAGRSLVPQQPASILAVFDRALALQPDLTPALIHPLEITMLSGDSARFDRYLGQLRSHTGPVETEHFVRWQRVLWGDPDSVPRVLQQSLSDLPRFIPTNLIHAILRTGRVDPEVLMAALDAALAESAERDARRESYLREMLVSVLLATGRISRASLELDRLRAIDTGTADALAFRAASSGIAPTWTRLVSSTEVSDSLQPYRRAIMALGRGDVSGASLIAREGLDSGTELAPTAGDLLRAVLGRVQVLEGDTANGLRELQSGLLAAGYNAPSGILRHHLFVTMALREATRDEGVIALRHTLTDLELIAPSYLALSQAYAATGDDSSARMVRSQVERLWSGADGPVRLQLIPSGSPPAQTLDAPSNERTSRTRTPF